MWGPSARDAVAVLVLAAFMVLPTPLTVGSMQPGKDTSMAVSAGSAVQAQAAPSSGPHPIFNFKNAGSIVADPRTGYLYVEDQGFGRVTVYDPARSSVVGFLEGVGGPMVLDPASGELVFPRGDGLAFLNATSGGVVATVSGLASRGWWHPVLALDPVDGLVFASENFYSGPTGITMGSTIHVVSMRLHAAVAEIGGLWYSTGMAFDPQDGDLYVVNLIGGMTAIDPRSDTVIGSLKGMDGPNQIAFNPVDGNLYVACYNGWFRNGTIVWTAAVDVIDPRTLQIVGALPGFAPGSQPTYVVYADAGQDLFVATQSQVIAVGAASQVERWSRSGLNYPGPLVYDPMDARVYASVGDGLMAIDPVTFQVTPIGYDYVGPLSVAVDPTTNRVYAPNHGSPTITVIDASTDRIVGSLPGFVWAISATYDPLADELFVGNEHNASLTIIDLKTDHTVGTIGNVSPWSVLYDNVTGDLVVGTGSGLAVISGRTNAVVANITGHGELAPLALDPVHGRVFALTVSNAFVPVPRYFMAINLGDGSVVWNDTEADPGVISAGYDSVHDRVYAGFWTGGVVAMDASDGRNLTRIPGPFMPQTVLFDPANGYVYVGDQSGGPELWVIDSSTNQVVQTIRVPDDPNQMAYDPVNQELYVALGPFGPGSGLVFAVPSVSYPPAGTTALPLALGVMGIIAAVALPPIILRVRLGRRARRRPGSPK